MTDADKPATPASPGGKDLDAKSGPKKAGVRIDFGSIAGLAVALLGILGGLVIEGGKTQGCCADHGGADRAGRNQRRGAGFHADERRGGRAAALHGRVHRTRRSTRRADRRSDRLRHQGAQERPGFARAGRRARSRIRSCAKP